MTLLSPAEGDGDTAGPVVAARHWLTVIESAPTGILVSGPGTDQDPSGPLAERIVYANQAARARVNGADLAGMVVRESLPLLGITEPNLSRIEVGDGLAAWYLSEESASAVRDLRYAAAVSDALAGSLNLRRTLHRIVDLAVPALGEWAAVTYCLGDQLRQLSRSSDGGADDRTVPVARLDDDERHLLGAVLANTSRTVHPVTPTWLRMLGASEADVDRLCARPGETRRRLSTVPLRANGQMLGLLCVVAPERLDTGFDTVGLGAAGVGPAGVGAAGFGAAGFATAGLDADGVGAAGFDTVGLDALARRGAVAVAAAGVYEERSLLASTLRAALLPAPLPSIEGIRVGAAYRSAQETTEIGGDFYEVRAESRGWSATIGDVCGKGVEAAMWTGQVRQSLRTVSLVTEDPVRRLELLNSALLSTDGTSFVTLVHAYLRAVEGAVAVRMAAGGHPPPLLRAPDGQVTEIEAPGPIVGMLSDVSFRAADFEISSGATLLCFTDGLAEARGPLGFFGSERLVRLLSDCGGMTAQSICERILQNVLEHLDGRPHDDMAVLAVQVEPAG